MKKKFLRQKWVIISQSLGVVFVVIWQIGGFLIVGFSEKQSERTVIIIFLILEMIVILAAFIGSGGTVCFEDTYFVYKRTALSKKLIFGYDEMAKIEMHFYNEGGYRWSKSPMIYIWFKQSKKIHMSIEIWYEIVYYLIKNKPSRCQVKIHFYSLKYFTEQYRELLADYLTERQKEELARLIAEKEAKQKKKKIKK